MVVTSKKVVRYSNKLWNLFQMVLNVSSKTTVNGQWNRQKTSLFIGIQ